MEAIKRGDVVAVSLPGAYGKPQPGVIVQNDAANPTHPSFIVCPITSDLENFYPARVPLVPNLINNLRKDPVVMVDKVTVVQRHRVGKKIGHLTGVEMTSIDRALAIWLGLRVE